MLLTRVKPIVPTWNDVTGDRLFGFSRVDAGSCYPESCNRPPTESYPCTLY